MHPFRQIPSQQSGWCPVPKDPTGSDEEVDEIFDHRNPLCTANCAAVGSGTLPKNTTLRKLPAVAREMQRTPSLGRGSRGQGRRRSVDLWFFRPALYQLSYLTLHNHARTVVRAQCVAGATGFEPATSGLTGRRELQTSPRPRGAPPREFESLLPP